MDKLAKLYQESDRLREELAKVHEEISTILGTIEFPEEEGE